MTNPKYPEVTVPLTGEDGNALFIVGRVTQAMKEAGIPMEARNKFARQAFSSDYDNVLRTVTAWVNVR